MLSASSEPFTPVGNPGHLSIQSVTQVWPPTPLHSITHVSLALARSLVDGGRHACQTAAYHDEIVELPLRPRADPELGCQVRVRGLNQNRPVLKDNRRNYLLAIVGLLNVLSAFFVLVDVDPVIWNALLTEELFGSPTIGAPRSAVDLDVCI